MFTLLNVFSIPHQVAEEHVDLMFCGCGGTLHPIRILRVFFQIKWKTEKKTSVIQGLAKYLSNMIDILSKCLDIVTNTSHSRRVYRGGHNNSWFPVIRSLVVTKF